MHRIILLTAVLVAGGCSSYETGFLRYGDEPLVVRPSGAHVAVYRRAPERPHREIGEVFAVGRSIDDMEGIRGALVDRAAAVGAEAVILARVVAGFEEYGSYGGCRNYGAYYDQGWGWGCPPVYYQALRTVVMLRGVAVVWTGPEPEGAAPPDPPTAFPELPSKSR